MIFIRISISEFSLIHIRAKIILPNIRIFSLTTAADNDFSRWSNFTLKRVYKNYQKAKNVCRQMHIYQKGVYRDNLT